MLDFSVSEDGKTITEVVCPKCKERIAVSVPVIEGKKAQSKETVDVQKEA